MCGLLAWRAMYSFLFEDVTKCLLPVEVKWVVQTMSPKERETFTVKRQYRPCI